MDLKQWFQKNKRSFPWRESPTPYGVWVSEIMLQQTQAVVVVPYFQRWMELFPDIQALAVAPLEQVIKAWEGLGYYSRARNLHEGAKYVVEQHQGIIPSTVEELSKIKGVGPYTVGAILSFAFHQRVAAVDGNVIRVLSRYFGVKEDISKPKTVKIIREYAESFLPEKESWITGEALIELGATVCKKRAECRGCPLQPDCQAYRFGLEKELPYKSKKVKIEQLKRSVFVFQCKGKLLLKQVERGEIMSGLHEFPYLEEWVDGEQLSRKVVLKWGGKVSEAKELKKVEHSFTRYQVTLKPYHCFVEKPFLIPGYSWEPFTRVKEFAFSSGHRRVLEQVVQLS